MIQILWVPVASTFSLILFLRYFCRSRFIKPIGVIAALLSTLFTLIFFISDQITGEGITEATLFHLTYGLSGLNPLNFPFELAFVSGTLLLMTAALAAALFRTREGRLNRLSLPVEATILGFLVCFSVAVHPTVLEINHFLRKSWSPSAHSLNDELAGIDGLSHQDGPPKNLVYLYVESVERLFLDDRVFPGLAGGLRTLEQDSLSIRGIRQAPMTDWTIAGMVASQCGVPLATFKPNRNDLGDVESFVPGVTCLGDILTWFGYRNVYLGGADLHFAGKQRFYPDHGVKEIFGVDELQALHGGRLPTSRWGVYDDTLLQTAFDKFRELSAGEQPFALFLLTLDTHPPRGHETPSCKSIRYGEGGYAMLNAVHCADRLVSEFVTRIEDYAAEQRSENELVVIVASDHLMMHNEISPILDEHRGQRENLWLARSAELEPGVVQREATTLDIAPTVLSLLGWDVESMALGRNLLKPAPTLIERYGQARFFTMLQHWRLNLWKTWVPSTE